MNPNECMIIHINTSPFPVCITRGCLGIWLVPWRCVQFWFASVHLLVEKHAGDVCYSLTGRWYSLCFTTRSIGLCVNLVSYHFTYKLWERNEMSMIPSVITSICLHLIWSWLSLLYHVICDPHSITYLEWFQVSCLMVMIKGLLQLLSDSLLLFL